MLLSILLSGMTGNHVIENINNINSKVLHEAQQVMADAEKVAQIRRFVKRWKVEI